MDFKKAFGTPTNFVNAGRRWYNPPVVQTSFVSFRAVLYKPSVKRPKSLMNETESSYKLTWVIWLLSANLIVMAIAAGALVLGLLPKIERAIETTERVEARFQAFADEVQPVLTAGAGKAIETITKMDADKLSKTATEKTDSLMDAAAERAKRFLGRDKSDDN